MKSDRRAAAPAWALTRTLNPILKGWAYYHRHIVAKKTFSDVDEFVFAKLVRWMKRKHPNKSWRWKIRKYFLTPDGWQFHDTDREGKTVRLFRTQTVVIKRHVKVKGNANPYDPAWEMYFERRQEQKMQVRIKPRGGRPSSGYFTEDSKENVPFAKPRLQLTPDGIPEPRWPPHSGETSGRQVDAKHLSIVASELSPAGS